MVVTAKLSRKLYETLGEDAAQDMVTWMQRVDDKRAELRELNEANFARFDARLGERSAELQGALARSEAQLDELRSGIDAKISDLRREMETGFARLETRIEQRTADIMKWSFVFWVGSVATVVGALVALSRFLP